MEWKAKVLVLIIIMGTVINFLPEEMRKGKKAQLIINSVQLLISVCAFLAAWFEILGLKYVLFFYSIVSVVVCVVNIRKILTQK